MAAKRKEQPLNLLAVLFGMVIAPGETCQNLLSDTIPRHFITLYFLLFVIIFAPPIANLTMHEREIYRPEILGILLLVFFLTLINFIIAERLLLLVIGVKTNLFKVSAVVSYALIPMMVGFLVLYAASYYITGDITYLTFIPSGVVVDDPTMKTVLPYVTSLGTFFTLIILYQAIRALENMYWGNAFIITALSLICFAFSLLIALFVGNIIAPDTIDTFQLLNSYPEAVLNV